MSYSKEDIKENISMDDVYDLLDFLGAEPKLFSDHIEAITICHCGGHVKLFYYENSQLFQCYTNCGSFDIIELIEKVKNLDFNGAIYFLVNYFNLQWKIDKINADIDYSLEDWKIFDRSGEIKEIQENDAKFHKIQLESYDDSIIKYFPQPIILDWKDSFINPEVCQYMNIHYDPTIGAIVIPHYDEDGNCVGIRQRTLIAENEKYGKYRPWFHNKKQYNHALAFNLYGINLSKQNIQKGEIAIVFEGEKSVLQYLSYFGLSSDLAVAVCGSNFSKYQFELLQRFGAKEIVIAFDKDFKNKDDEEGIQKFIDKMRKINDKYNSKCNLSFIVDTEDLLDYKNSPTDRGKETFLKLFRNRYYMKSVVEE